MERQKPHILFFLTGVFLLAAALFLLLPFRAGLAGTGVLIPSSVKDEPDDKILSLGAMNVDICIDNQHVSVKVTQVFDSHHDQTLEGKYLFALPEKASVSDFAVWDKDTRIPGVMLEKRRANEIYSEIKQKEIDPGILQQDDEHGGTSAFSAKVVPIPAYGTKRIEMEYTQVLPIENLSSNFTFPLKPGDGATQKVSEFTLTVCVYNDYPISSIDFGENAPPLQVTKETENAFEAEFRARDYELKVDLSINYRIEIPHSTLSFISYRAPEKIDAYEIRNPALARQNPEGYFQAQTIFNEEINSAPENTRPRRIVLLLDTSLSMYGEKLEKAFEASRYFLQTLTPSDEFNVILFNQGTQVFSPTPLTATTENIERSLDFIKQSPLGGGTDLEKALETGIEAARRLSVGEKELILISDANPTLETNDINTIISRFEEARGKSDLRLFAFAPGSDANVPLLKELTDRTRGYFEQVRETEDIALLLQNFFAKIGNPTFENLSFLPSATDNFYQVYPTGENSFDGSSFSFVGRYKKPSENETIGVSASFAGEDLNIETFVKLPELNVFVLNYELRTKI